MNLRKWLAPVSGALMAALMAGAAHADADKVIIGDIDDMSGVYADVIGPKAVEAIKMAIADFGGKALGQPIEILTYDHQNKPDLGAQKFREFADRDGVTMVLGGSNTGVSLAMSPVAKEKKIPFFAIGAAGASLTGKDCTPYTMHYAYDTTALGNGTATTILNQGGKSWFFLTADYAFGTQLQQSAERVVNANGGKVIGSVRVPLGTTDFSSFLLQAQSSGAQVLGLANAGNDFSNSLKAANEFGIAKTMKPAALLAFISDINGIGLETAQGLYLTDRLVLGPQRQVARFRQALLRKDRRHADHEPGRLLFGDADLPQRRQGRRHDRRRQGDGRTAQGQDQRHVHRQRRHPRRRPARTRHVHHAGQEALGVQGSVGLLQARPDDVGRAGLRQTRRFRLPPGQEVDDFRPLPPLPARRGGFLARASARRDAFAPVAHRANCRRSRPKFPQRKYSGTPRKGCLAKRAG